MNRVKFSDIKDQLQQVLQNELNLNPIPGETQGFALIEGFVSLYLQGEISNNVIINGPNIPVVGIVSNRSGRVYTYALKALLPDIQI